ncbi:MAG TPA: hypothetical protein DHV07_01520 [Flavobacteriales bacterium]|nr:hypothetical protein [Flavobacteriales bacterium]
MNRVALWEVFGPGCQLLGGLEVQENPGFGAGGEVIAAVHGERVLMGGRCLCCWAHCMKQR